MRATVLAKKKLRKATSIQKWFENEIKKNREFQSNLSTFSACNFQLEIFDYHYPNNHNSKKKAFSCCLENLSYYHEFLCFSYNSRCKQDLKLSSSKIRNMIQKTLQIKSYKSIAFEIKRWTSLFKKEWLLKLNCLF